MWNRTKAPPLNSGAMLGVQVTVLVVPPPSSPGIVQVAPTAPSPEQVPVPTITWLACVMLDGFTPRYCT